MEYQPAYPIEPEKYHEQPDFAVSKLETLGECRYETWRGTRDQGIERFLDKGGGGPAVIADPKHLPRLLQEGDILHNSYYGNVVDVGSASKGVIGTNIIDELGQAYGIFIDRKLFSGHTAHSLKERTFILAEILSNGREVSRTYVYPKLDIIFSKEEADRVIRHLEKY